MVTFAEDWNQPDVVNTNQHPTVSNLMAPLEQAGIEWSVSKLCQAAKVKGGIALLPFVPNWRTCYWYILGRCKKRYPTRCNHVDRDKLTDATVEDLCNMLAPGVAALCAEGARQNHHRQRKRGSRGDSLEAQRLQGSH